jgi:hypothetical protein
MKRLFTLALILSVAAAGYSQVRKVSSKDNVMKAEQTIVVNGSETYDFVASTPNMLRENAELDYTTYDWQTNTAARNLTMNFPDGTVGFAHTVASDANMTDRGTDIIIYDPASDGWTTVGGKIENRKTGFGCAARYGQNGIVVVSRDANSLDCGVYIIPDKDNLPAPGTVAPIKEWTKDDRNIHFPAVMCTGPNHDHIHILFTAYNWTDADGLTNPFFYFRSMDGGQTWEEFMTIDYLGRTYNSAYGSGQDAYFMENKGGDELNIVVNTRRGDGVVLTSTDEGNTWTRTKFYHHPGIDVNYGDEGMGYMYPRWTSALWDSEGVLHVAYEMGGGTGDATSTSYYPGVGGVAYWNSELPFRAEGSEFGYDPNNPMPPVTGQPFIMDSAYLYYDTYRSWWLWSDAPHEMLPEFIGYVTPLDENDQPLEDPYTAEEFNLYDNGMSNHGHYNGGPSEMPVLMITPDEQLMVAVWMSMDDHNITGGATNDMAFFKLFTKGSYDKGLTWTPMYQLTSGFEFSITEFVYPQASICGDQLVIVAQTDYQPDSYTIGTGGDIDQTDCFYQGLTFDLTELFPGWDGIGETVSHNTTMSIYPNPASDVLNITLNQDEEVVIYTLTGQAISSFQGHAGVNNYNVNSLNSGVYFISAGSATQKLVVK